MSPHVRESKTLLESGFHAVDSGFQLQDSRLELLVGFRISTPVFRIPRPMIPDSTSKNCQDSGFQMQKFPRFRNPDSFTWGERLSDFSIFLCRLLLPQCPNKYTYVPRNPASGRTWWLERSLLLKTHFAAKDCTSIKGAIPCYLLSFQKTSIQLNSKNNGPALLSVAINGKDRHGLKLKKVAPVFTSFKAMPAKSQKNIIMVSAFWWNLLSSSSQLYRSILCMGKGKKYHRNIACLAPFTPVRTNFWIEKTCTDPPFVYTGVAEQHKFLKSKQFCNL